VTPQAPTLMHVSDVMLWRDGGTITFVLSDGASAGNYRLQTPFAGEPRFLFRDEGQLPYGGAAEREVAIVSRAWLQANVTQHVEAALQQLDLLHEWRSLPGDLGAVVPLHRIRTVITCLEARTGAQPAPEADAADVQRNAYIHSTLTGHFKDGSCAS